MNLTSLFCRLITTNLKRLKSYIIPLFISVLVLLLSCGIAGKLISSNLYKEKNMTKITLAYYLPNDEDMTYNLVGLSFFENIDSVQNTANLVQVNTIDEGKNMVESGNADYFVIIPELFFSGIMNGTNPAIEIIIRENSSASAHVINELFLSYGRYLGVAQAAVYSAIDTARNHELSSEEVKEIQDKVNATFLNRALKKDNYTQTISATNEGNYTLLEHYLASALMITLFFVAVVFMPIIKEYGNGVMSQLNSRKINTLHIYLCNFFTTLIALYVSYIPCHIGISIYTKHFNPAGFITVIPALCIMSLIIALIASLSKNLFTANIVLLCVVITIAYIGGGLLPRSFLPQIIQQVSNYLPGEYLISTLAKGLF